MVIERVDRRAKRLHSLNRPPGYGIRLGVTIDPKRTRVNGFEYIQESVERRSAQQGALALYQAGKLLLDAACSRDGLKRRRGAGREPRPRLQ